MPGADPPLHYLTVRIGCSFVYEVTRRVPIVLNFKPRRQPPLLLHSEILNLGPGLPSEEFEDAHGNVFCRLVMPPGRWRMTHDAIVGVRPTLDNTELGPGPAVPPDLLPPQLLRYTLPSRYCDSDKFLVFACQQFGALPPGKAQAEAVCDWVHRNIEYRFASGSPELSAHDVFRRGYGVCRDYAHLMVALCRALNLPARYVVGHLPDIGYFDPGTPMDFHAYAEVYLGGEWHTYDARYGVPRIGRVKISTGHDAVDSAFATVYGPAALLSFDVWAYQIAPGTVKLGDPIDLNLRLDGKVEIRGL